MLPAAVAATELGLRSAALLAIAILRTGQAVFTIGRLAEAITAACTGAGEAIGAAVIAIFARLTDPVAVADTHPISGAIRIVAIGQPVAILILPVGTDRLDRRGQSAVLGAATGILARLAGSVAADRRRPAIQLAVEAVLCALAESITTERRGATISRTTQSGLVGVT